MSFHFGTFVTAPFCCRIGLSQKSIQQEQHFIQLDVDSAPAHSMDEMLQQILDILDAADYHNAQIGC